MRAPSQYWRVAAAVAILTTCLLTACGGAPQLSSEGLAFAAPETNLAYDAVVKGAPSDAMRETLETSLLLFSARAKGAPSLAHLRRRAQKDMEMAGRILRSEGYYKGAARFDLAATSAPGGPAKVVVFIDPGPRFVLGGYEIVYTWPPGTTAARGAAVPGLADLGLTIGDPAVAAPIAAAEEIALKRLRESGRPYAKKLDRVITADMEANALEVTLTIDPGPRASFGPTVFSGGEGVGRSYLRTYSPWREGEEFDQSKLGEYQRALSGTGLFDSVSVRRPPEAGKGVEGDEPTPLPITVEVEERARRTVNAGMRYSTDLGPSVRLGYEHRNLFGAGEKFRATADLGLKGQSLETTLRKPQYLRAGQDLIGGAIFKREQDDAFDEKSITGQAGLKRTVTRQLRIGVGGLGEVARIDSRDEEKFSYLLGTPLFAVYDDSDDLLDPTRGVRGRFSVTPYGGSYDAESTVFLSVESTGSTYWAVDDAARYVLAARGRLGAIVGAARNHVPETRRFYAGGGGSVRGYKNRFVGPLDDDGDPLGGRSVAEAALEARVKITENIGVAPFVDAGVIADKPVPNLGEGVQIAAGLGGRYYTAVGPVRFDLAFPLNPREEDKAYQAYISIGQAF